MSVDRRGDDVLLKKRARADSVLLDGFSAYEVGELGNSPRTAVSYSYSLKCLARWSGRDLFTLGSKGANDLRAFKREADYKNTTKQQVVVAMHRFHEWGAQEGLWELNGILAVPSPKVRLPLKAPLSLESARRVIEEAKRPLEKRVVLLGLYAGCRISESAEMDETHLAGGWLTFTGKGNKKRRVPVHPELANEIDDVLSFRPSSKQVLHSSFARLRDRIGLLDEEGETATSHTLRRTCGSALYDAGVPWEVVARLLGHGADVTARYAKIRPDVLKDSIAKLDYYKGQPVQGTLF